MAVTCRPPVQERPRVAEVAPQSNWERQMFGSKAPRTAEDSDRIWERMERDKAAEELGPIADRNRG